MTLKMIGVFFITVFVIDLSFCAEQQFFKGSCQQRHNCHDLCLEIQGGGHTCDCQLGYELQADGTSCLPTEHSSNAENFQAEKQTSNSDIVEEIVNNPPTLSINDGFQLTSDKKVAKETKGTIEHGEFAGGTIHNIPPNTKELQAVSRTSESSNLIAVPKYETCNNLFCANNGQCVKDTMRGGFRCQCPLGFAGERCQKEIETRYPKFRGESYLAFQGLRTAYKDFTIHIVFRPQTSNGLVLFAGEKINGRGDFFSLALVDQGFVEFRFDCGTGMAIIHSKKKVRLGEWNNVTIYRNEQEGWMKVNDGQKISGRSKGQFSRITLRTNFFLGGYLNTTIIGRRTGMHYGFVGCVKSLQVNEHKYDMRKGSAFIGDAIQGIDVDDCSSGACDNLHCTNGGYCTAVSPDKGVCMCPMGYAGKTCSKVIGRVYVPKFQGNSYLRFEGLRRTVLTYSEIEIIFKPQSPDGLLFYNGYTTDRRGDFMSLALVDGHMEFQFDLGTGPAVIRSVEPITMDNWHVVTFTRTGRDGVLKVDDQPEVEGLSMGAYTQLTLMLDMFIGGHENYDDTSKFLGVTTSFNGCIQKVSIDDVPLHLLDDAQDGKNIDHCEHPCSGMPCINDGVCLPEKERFTCSCPLGYENTNCETESKKNIQRPMFGGKSYLVYEAEPIMKRISGTKVDVQIRVKLSGDDGLLLWSGEYPMTSSSDYMALAVVDGHAQFSYNLGSGEVIIVNDKTKIDDGKWHWVRAQRDQQVGLLEIDRHSIVEGISDGPLKQLNTDTSLYIGGAKNIDLVTMRKFTSGFSGCISNLTLATDYHVKLLKEADDGRNIKQCS